MYSDTHFHFSLVTGNNAATGAALLSALAERNCFFGMDIGTSCGDLAGRQQLATSSLDRIDGCSRIKAADLLHFSAGIWPDPEAIRKRTEQLSVLESQVTAAQKNGVLFAGKLAAIGECGLDHHWNQSGTDSRCESDFNQALFDGEKELFEMQLGLAKRLHLPVVVHSRDAFADTLDCIRRAGYDNGIIHCYSYGQEEAKAFLDRGWYISFSGSVTYTKKSRMDSMRDLLRYIPADRILLETDAPYLAPVPLRGNPATPLYVEYTYRFIADVRSIPVEELCIVVDRNCRTLFGIQ